MKFKLKIKIKSKYYHKSYQTSKSEVIYYEPVKLAS